MNPWVLIGTVLIITGFVFIAIGALTAARDATVTTETGAVLFIGPVPVVFGSSERAAAWALVLALLLVVLLWMFRQ